MQGVTLVSHYVYQAPKNAREHVPRSSGCAKNKLGVPNLFTPDGFVTAQMICQALQKGGTDTAKQISALEGWQFLAPKGKQRIRPQDHAMLQPMFQVQLVAGQRRPLRRQGAEDRLAGQRPASRHAVQVGATTGTDGMNPPILATRNLGLDIGGAKIVADVSLEVAEGELLGIIGPNGAGQDVALQPPLGHLPADRRLDPPERRRHHAPADVPAHARGDRPDVPGVERLPAPDVHENVRLAAEAALGGTLRLWRRALSVRGGARARAGRARRASASRRKSRGTAGALAHGDKRRLEIAMLLAADKPVLMLDEPMAGLSAEHVPAARRAHPRGAHARRRRRC